MRWSKALIPTLKETPADAVAPSHILLLRAGMIRQLGAGAYSYLPLGFRVLNKAIQIVREEMDAAGAQEMLMPAIQPIELWEETGRATTMREVLMRFKISGDREVVLGPTHEEPVTDIVRALVKSYKQLPLTLYQIQTKFRDEARPRFGILRTREFLMKDAYSFDADLAQLNASYDAMYEAYCRIFDRCGIPYVVVEAESGPIGGDSSHEFMIPAATGEDTVVQCARCDYAANRERAEIGAPPEYKTKDVERDEVAPEDEAGTKKSGWLGRLLASKAESAPAAPPFERVETPNRRTIQEVCDFLKIHESGTAKLLVFLADGKPVAVLVRGDHEANEAKVRRAFGAATLATADAATIEKVTGAPLGFLGPVDIKIPMAVDFTVALMSEAVVGGNATDVHLKGVVPGRDFPLDHVHDLRNAAEGDPCPRCGGGMTVKQGIEIGHVFKLGTKYSKAMGATFLDDKGSEIALIMGCYGIGINRIVAGAVEASHDENGIIWPLPLAPYEVLVVPLQTQNAAVLEAAVGLEKQFLEAGVDVLLDDREQRPGVKFKDADLIGIPLRVVIGERGLKEGTIEIKWRTDAQPHHVSAATAGEAILAELEATRKQHEARCVERRIARAAARGH